MASSHAFLLVVALALVTGCINGDPIPPTPSSAPPSAPAAMPTPSTPESLAAQHNATPAPAPAANGTNATSSPVEVPYAWESRLPAQACRPDPVTNGCAGALPADGGSDAPPVTGNVTRASLSLTWTPAAPGGVAEMRFALLRGETVLGEATGPSPLALDVEIPAGEGVLTVSVSAASMTPGPLVGYAHAEQPFSVEGVFLVGAPSPSPTPTPSPS